VASTAGCRWRAVPSSCRSATPSRQRSWRCAYPARRGSLSGGRPGRPCAPFGAAEGSLLCQTMNADDFASLRLYDPDAPDADDQLALLRYLVDLGATSDDLVLHHEQDQLAGLATVLALRGGPGLTLGEVAERSSLDEDHVVAFMRAAGFPIPGPSDRVISQSFATLSGLPPVAEELFGA